MSASSRRPCGAAAAPCRRRPGQGHHHPDLRQGRHRGIAPPAGARRFLGAVVRPLQDAEPDHREGRAGRQGRRAPGQDEHRRPSRRSPASSASSRSPRSSPSQRPAGRRLHRRPAREPGQGLHRPRRRPGRSLRAPSASSPRARRCSPTATSPSAAERFGAALKSEPAVGRRRSPAWPRCLLASGELERARQTLAMLPDSAAADPQGRCRPRPDRARRPDRRTRRRRRARGADRGQPGRPPGALRPRPAPQRRGRPRRAPSTGLLEIMRKNRSWEEEKARKQLLQFFEAWGPTDEATLGRAAQAVVGAVRLRRPMKAGNCAYQRPGGSAGGHSGLSACRGACSCRAPSMPLNIFEPRYLAMIDAALAGDRVVGMIQPDEASGAVLARAEPLHRSAAPAASPPSPRPATAAT